METVMERMLLYQNLFWGCLLLFFVGLILSVVLYRVLDIQNVWGYLSGHKERKEIAARRAIENRNAGATEALEMFAVEREWMLIHTEEHI